MNSYLYPRLPPAVARKIFNDYRRQSPKELQTQGRLRHPDAIYTPLGGTEVSESHLEQLASAIREAAARAGYPDERGSQKQRDNLDLECADILHRRMGVVAAEAASIDVWAFVGAVLLPDVCFWRFPDPPEDRVIGPDLTRHALARLWWRAYQLADLDRSGGLAALAAISESEMNQLFERRSIGGNRVLVRSMARVLMQTHDDWEDVPSRQLVRHAASRIRRLIAFSMMESLEEAALDSLVFDIFTTTASVLTTSEDGTSIDSLAVEPHGERESATAGAAETGLEPTVHFDHVLLADIPAQIAALVNDRGGLSDDDLVPSYGRRFGIHVPADEYELVRRFAWSAKGRRFIEFDEKNALWLPGSRAPERIEQLDEWTIARIRERAREMLRGNPDADPFELLMQEVYKKSGGRFPKFMMRIVGRIVNEARREQS